MDDLLLHPYCMLPTYPPEVLWYVYQCVMHPDLYLMFLIPKASGALNVKEPGERR